MEKYAKNDESVRVVILTGAGEKTFSAGADIKAMKGMNALKAGELSLMGKQTLQRPRKLLICQ